MREALRPKVVEDRRSMAMKYRRFAPLERELSLLVLGTDVFTRWDDQGECFALLDAWAEVGGNVIDTGRQYGHAERVVGEWLRARGLRESVMVLTKVGHPDEDTWESRLSRGAVTREIRESLAELDLETIDLLMLHRDDENVPVAALIETLNEERNAGRIGAFGASNWTSTRIAAANAHARECGLEPFTCASPALSLAEWIQPPWRGCVSAHDQQSREFYTREQLPLFAWSAQARGYFAGNRSEETRRTYGGAANAERLARTEKLGAEKGATATQVALAWVLAQPFPVHALIGPETTQELYSSVDALSIELTPAELAWLNLEGE